MSVCGFVAILLSLVRLWIRRGRLWWDDAWVLVSMTSLVLQIVAVFLHIPNPGMLDHALFMSES